MKIFRPLFRVNTVRIPHLSNSRLSMSADHSFASETGIMTTNSFCNPALTGDEIAGTNNLVGLNIGLTFIAWARIECEKNKFTHLDYLMFPENFNRMDPIDIYSLAMKIMKRLPLADRYVMENVRKSFSNAGGHLQLTLQTSRFQMISTLICLLNNTTKSDAESQAVVLMKQKLTGKLFNLLVGNEMISCKGTVLELLAENFVEEPSPDLPACSVKADEQLLSKYNKAPDVGKELMGRAFLNTLTFVELIIHKNPDCLKRIQGQVRYGSAEQKTR